MGGSPSGKFVAPFASLSHSPPVVEVVNEMLFAKARAGRSDRYLRVLRANLKSFTAGRAARPLGSVSVPEVESWIAAQPPGIARTRLGDVGALFNFALRRGYVAANPVAAVDKPAKSSKPPLIHSPEQVAAVLEAVRSQDPGMCRAMAVQYFAGLRSSEVAALERAGPEWIEVPAAVAKSRKRRIVAVSANLRAWLAIPGAFPVRQWCNRHAAAVAAARAAWPGLPWAGSVARHCFCSYHLAAHQNAGKTAIEAGHSEAMLFSHYRAVVAPEAAAEFWRILPK